MKTFVRVLRGRFSGQSGWISGDLDDRAARGVTRALVHLASDVEMLATSSLAPAEQLDLFGDAPETKTPPAVSQRRAMFS